MVAGAIMTIGTACVTALARLIIVATPISAEPFSTAAETAAQKLERLDALIEQANIQIAAEVCAKD